MRFIKLFKFDLNYGIIKAYKKYVAYLLLMIPVFFEFYVNINSFRIKHFSYADVLMYIFGGVKEYTPSLVDPFQIPYIWSLNHLLILYFILNYMNKDLEGFGQQTIYRSKSRNIWWFSKCITQIISVGLYYLLAWFELLILTLVLKGNATLNLSSFISNIVYAGDKVISDNWNLSWELMLMPFLFTVSMSLIQMALCLFFRAVLSYVVSVIVCISSSYCLSPFLIGNYSMPIRSDKIVSNGVNMEIGVIILILIAAAGVIVGLFKFKKQNILSKG